MVRDSRVIAAILAADVVDYSRLMGADESGALAALKVRRAIFDEVVAEFGGRPFGSVGDSLMAEFPSAVNAVTAALAIQERVESGNAPLGPAQRMQLRIGVNLGDVIEEGGDVFGDAVNVAARLQALARPGGIVISGSVYEQVRLKLPARFINAGTRHVKNIREPVQTYDVLPPEPPGLGGRLASFLAHVASRRVVRAAAAGVMVGLAITLALFWRELPVPATGERLGTLLEVEAEAPPPNAVAVLPFVNLSGDPDNDYLGAGLAEELTSRLAKIPGLRVAARTSTFAFRDKDVGVQEIANRLGVSYVVEGSVKRQGTRVRVNAALVERANGASRWSNSFESSSGDFFAIEDEIGTQLLTALELALGTAVERPAAPTVRGSVVAYDYFLQGLSYLRKPKRAPTLDAAEELFLRALAEQPDFARAQAGLCQTRVERYALEKIPVHIAAAEDACGKAQALDSSAQEVYEAVGRLRLETGNPAEAETAYRHALAIVPESPDVLIGLAAALAAEGKTAEAESAHRRAITAQPRYLPAHMTYGNFLFLQGRPSDALAPYERATILAPDNPNAFNNLGSAYLYTGDFDRAAEAFSHSLAIEPRRAGYSNMGLVHYYRGRHDEAAAMFRKAVELTPADHRLWGNLADALRFAVRPEEAREAYRRALEMVDLELAINPRHAVNQAQAAYYASRLGKRDRARDALEIALAEGEDSYYVHYYVALAELGLGDAAAAAEHARTARELGYPEKILRAAPEFEDLRAII